jgi:hypothetical protein
MSDLPPSAPEGVLADDAMAKTFAEMRQRLAQFTGRVKHMHAEAMKTHTAAANLFNTVKSVYESRGTPAEKRDDKSEENPRRDPNPRPRAKFRYLSTEQFNTLTPREKVAYLERAKEQLKIEREQLHGIGKKNKAAR